MKRYIQVIAIAILVLALFTGCVSNSNEQAPTVEPTKDAGDTESTDAPVETDQVEQEKQEEEQEEEQEEQEEDKLLYEFELTDIDGNVHKLSDYKGKPVYLEVWGSWCSVCMTVLPDMNELAGADNDYHVLSVVFPNMFGEKSKEDFIEWYKELGYENLTVLMDEDAKIAYDFGISAFPSQVFFDKEGNFAGGRIGPMTHDEITEQMKSIANQ